MLTALVATLALAASPARELNAQGEALVKQGDYKKALTLFRQATEADPRFAAAFYNQALALAALRRQPRGGPTKKDVLDAAESALALDPKLRERAEQELPAVRTTWRGQRLLGRSADKDLAAIVRSIPWRSRAAERLELLADGAARLWRSSAPVPGRWHVEGARLTLELNSRQYGGRLDSDGVLTIEGLGRFFDW
jgi:tetratricopeptide (TPR) repeat protein